MNYSPPNHQRCCNDPWNLPGRAGPFGVGGSLGRVMGSRVRPRQGVPIPVGPREQRATWRCASAPVGSATGRAEGTCLASAGSRAPGGDRLANGARVERLGRAGGKGTSAMAPTVRCPPGAALVSAPTSGPRHSHHTARLRERLTEPQLPRVTACRLGEEGEAAGPFIVRGTSACTGGWAARCAIPSGSGCGLRRRRRARGEREGRSPRAARPGPR